MFCQGCTDFVGAFGMHELVAQVGCTVEVADVYLEEAFEGFERTMKSSLVLVEEVEVVVEKVNTSQLVMLNLF